MVVVDSSDHDFCLKEDEVPEELHGAQEDEVVAEQDAPQQGEVNQIGQEVIQRRSKRLRKGATTVHTPYTAPRMVKNLVYPRRSS
ncbi:hypothetical protein Ddye_016938 [Dipteronia dyeriana]|uniref:Uncharacterized protein n=1 Tax=Dipteronia dyeriana TaxID=168575 RepID=A0AAD9U893_9ROSI|nr:hypothetical protein Ddye_016938 [Dipteronia dyeriana]